MKLGDHLTVRLDPHSNHKSLVNDDTLLKAGITIELGHQKNINHNGCAERAVAELKKHILNISPMGGPISSVTLAKAVANLNKVIRHNDLSSNEIWTSRDQSTGSNLHLDDEMLSDKQHKMRRESCASTAKYNARGSTKVPEDNFEKGEIVYVKSDISKSQLRQRYVIIEVDKVKKEAKIQKLLPKNQKRNIVIAQFKNLSKAIPHPIPKPSPTEIHVPNPEIPPFVTTRPKPPFSKHICAFCRNTSRPSFHHDPKKCPLMIQANPNQFHRRPDPKRTSDSDEDQIPLRPPQINIPQLQNLYNLQLQPDELSEASSSNNSFDTVGESPDDGTVDQSFRKTSPTENEEEDDLDFFQEDDSMDIPDIPQASPNQPDIPPALANIPLLQPIPAPGQASPEPPQTPPQEERSPQFQQIMVPTPNNRVVEPDQFVFYKVEENDNEENPERDPDKWAYGKIMKMTKKEIEKYPAWYNIKVKVKDVLRTRSKELFGEDQGRTWFIVRKEDVPPESSLI